jgi:CheY-like chemotaxis protein
MTPSQPIPNPQPSGKTILLVDDEPTVIKVMQDILEFLEHQVIVAANGHEAMRHYRHHKDEIDLVITDLDMPVMDGRALVSQLRADNPHLKIIITTANPIELESLDSPIFQVTLWLTKPFDMDVLIKALEVIEW